MRTWLGCLPRPGPRLSHLPGKPPTKHPNRESTVSPDLGERKTTPVAPPPTPAEQRKSTAQAAKAVGASSSAVEQAARVAKVAPDLLPQVQAGTMALPLPTVGLAVPDPLQRKRFD